MKICSGQLQETLNREFLQIKKELEKQKIKMTTGKEIWDVTTIQKMLKNEKYKGDALLQKTYTEDYLHGIRKKNTGQRAMYYVKGSHPAIIHPEIFDKVQEEMFQRARLIVDENGEQVNSGNRYSSKYLLSNLLVCGNCGAGFRRRTKRGKIVWRCGTRMEKGKEACRHSPTLQDEQIKKILADVLCDGIYDENIVKKKVKRIDVYEGQIIFYRSYSITTEPTEYDEQIDSLQKRMMSLIEESAKLENADEEFDRQYHEIEE